MIKIDFLKEAEFLREELVARRRDLHRQPELAFEEVRTAGIVADELRELGIEVQTGIGKTGVVGILEGSSDGPTILVRADMDALPIVEQNETDYVSIIEGKMHACGHDGHVTIALGVAKLLSSHRDHIQGRVKFVFQPAEEVAGGANAMVQDGVLENPRPDISFGLHLWNTLPVGVVGVGVGAVMASASDFNICIEGKGAHGAFPEDSQDPVICAAQIVTALQTIVSRNVKPSHTAVVSVTQINAGTAFNVIPPSAELIGTFRVYDTTVRDQVEQRIRDISMGVAEAMGCSASVEIHHFTEPVVNHASVTERAKNVFAKVKPDLQFVDERTMAAEDVGMFMDDIPGLFFFVGSANEARGLNYGHHHPKFDIDENALPLGVALLTSAVADYVIRDSAP